MQKAVTYARVSSADQRDTGYSIPAQTQLFREYCTAKGLEIVHEFQESESAKSRGRKLFSEMIAYVRKNKIKAIVFEKVDRMTRNFHDLVLVYELMEKDGIEIHLIKNSLLLDKNSRSQEKFQLDINVVLARNYINNLSEEVKKGMTQKAQNGGWNHRVPLGYINTRKNGVATIEPDPTHSQMVPEVFTRWLDGDSTHVIGDWASKVSGKKIYSSNISKMLKNPIYIGMIETTDGLIEGKHEGIVSKALFYSVQDKFKKRRGRPTPIGAREFRYSSILKCGCGSPMYGELKKGKYITYGCGRRQTAKQPCGQYPKYVSERIVAERVGDLLKRVTIDDAGLKLIQTMCRDMFRQIDDETDHKSDILNQEIKRLRAKISRLLDHYEDGILTKDEYLERKNSMSQDIAKKQAEYDALTTTQSNYRTTFMDVFYTFKNIDLYLESVEIVGDFQKILGSILSNLVFDGKTIEFSLTELGSWMLGASLEPFGSPTGIRTPVTRMKT